MLPSPMTATTCLSSLWGEPERGFFFIPTAIPKATDMEFEAWPQVQVSYSLSSGEGKGFRPPSLRLVWNSVRRPVSILCP